MSCLHRDWMTYPGEQHRIVIQTDILDPKAYEGPGTEQKDRKWKWDPEYSKQRGSSIPIGS